MYGMGIKGIERCSWTVRFVGEITAREWYMGLISAGRRTKTSRGSAKHVVVVIVSRGRRLQQPTNRSATLSLFSKGASGSTHHSVPVWVSRPEPERSSRAPAPRRRATDSSARWSVLGEAEVYVSNRTNYCTTRWITYRRPNWVKPRSWGCRSSRQPPIPAPQSATRPPSPSPSKERVARAHEHASAISPTERGPNATREPRERSWPPTERVQV